jgi:hypothetical protein
MVVEEGGGGRRRRRCVAVLCCAGLCPAGIAEWCHYFVVFVFLSVAANKEGEEGWKTRAN